MKTKTHFAFRVDIRDNTGDSIVEHVAGVDDFEVAEATYRAYDIRGLILKSQNIRARGQAPRPAQHLIRRVLY
jgi:hypothetical protein